MKEIKIKSALISVFNKDGLEPIIKELDSQGVIIYSTGGTQKFINDLGVKVIRVEDLTSYPSILGGRVKTLHPKVFGGILNRQDNESDKKELIDFEIPQIDLVIVDLYPFEETISSGASHSAIIEKIDIEPELDYSLEVIPIKYSKVTDLYGTMSALIDGGGVASAVGGNSGSNMGSGGFNSGFGGSRSGFGGGSSFGGSSFGGRSSFGGGFGGGGFGGGYRPYQSSKPVAVNRTSSSSVSSNRSSFQDRLRKVIDKAADGEEEIELLANARIVPDERQRALSRAFNVP